MLCRLIMQIHPGGVLFLVLPRRCIHSPMVGEAQFESLLAGLGCVQLLPKRLTPRIIFYILGRRTDMLSSHSSSSRSGSITTSVLKLENKVSLRQTDDKEHFTKWESKVCELIKLYMDEATVQHFSAPINNKEYSQLDKSSKQSEDPRKYKSLISKSTKEEETSVNSTSVIAPLVIEAQKFSLYIPIKYISQIRL